MSMKQLQCPHYCAMSGLRCFCMKGKFPVNCETCDCPDKYYVETRVTTNTMEIKNE